MATKVKGEAIKEGSIPFSALATEVKNKIENAGGGANWDAQEGEVGYIKNRTHCRFLPKFIPLVYNNEYIETYTGNDYPHGYKIRLDLENLYVYDNGMNYIGVINSRDFTELNVDAYTRIKYYAYSGWPAEMPDGEDWKDAPCLIVETDFDNINECFDYLNQEFLFGNHPIFYSKLDENYLPDTVLKTTPQTFTNAEKNQVKENLGISTSEILNSFVFTHEQYEQEFSLPDNIISKDEYGNIKLLQSLYIYNDNKFICKIDKGRILYHYDVIEQGNVLYKIETQDGIEMLIELVVFTESVILIVTNYIENFEFHITIQTNKEINIDSLDERIYKMLPIEVKIANYDDLKGTISQLELNNYGLTTDRILDICNGFCNSVVFKDFDNFQNRFIVQSATLDSNGYAVFALFSSIDGTVIVFECITSIYEFDNSWKISIE